jgi:hypothetical protein
MYRSLSFCLFITVFLLACHPSQKIKRQDMDNKTGIIKNDVFLSGLLRSYPQYFDSLLDDPQYGIQVIYTAIDRGQDNAPVFTDHYFHVNPGQYFYPASTVKLPVALLALQKLNELGIAGLDKNTTMITEAAYSGQTPVLNDSSSADGRATIAQYIKKILLVSDNDAFNRLYEFLGQEYINNSLHKMGYTDAQIIHRLDIFLSEDQNRHTNPIKFYDSASKMIFQKPMENSQWQYAIRNDKKGKGYYSGDQLINEPFDFSKKNRLSLTDLHFILRSVFFPENMKSRQRFNLAGEDYRFLYKYMSMFPRESKFPAYDSSYQDAYSRFLLWGEGKEKQPGTIRIFHKSGEAYGFLTDIVYVVDFEKNIEFMLSATIHCNSDGIYNDDKYDYETIGLPFMKRLGEVIYNYELKRERKYKPDLSPWKFDYISYRILNKEQGTRNIE